jgi:hypothetical protein
VVQQGVDEGAGLAAGGRMHRHAGGLVDHDEAPVLVQPAQAPGLGKRKKCPASIAPAIART